MIKPSFLSEQHRQYIQSKLQQLAQEQHIRILIACESGSRAWGVPSQNSDFDVRFIYVRSHDDYLSIENHSDVIETPIKDDDILGVPFDLGGWDLRKALLLALKSNAVLIEWLSSPLRYASDPHAVLQLTQFAKKHASLPALAYHYQRLGANAYKSIEGNAQVKVKSYCYALRPALALYWMRHNQRVPPMDIYNLCKGLPLEQSLVEAISDLVERKSYCLEADELSRVPALDRFISAELSVEVSRVDLEISKEKISEANELFRGMLAT